MKTESNFGVAEMLDVFTGKYYMKGGILRIRVRSVYPKDYTLSSFIFKFLVSADFNVASLTD